MFGKGITANLPLIVTLCVAVFIVFMAVRPAPAASMIPSQYRGLWCDVHTDVHTARVFRRCREAASEIYLVIRADRISVGFEEDEELCGVGRVFPTKDGHWLTFGCPKQKITGRIRLRFDARGRLHVEQWQSETELPLILIGDFCIEKSLSSDAKFYLAHLGSPNCKTYGGQINFRKTGYSGRGRRDSDQGPGRTYCEFQNIESGADLNEETDIYVVRANCRSGSGDTVVPPWTETFELRVPHGGTYISLRWLPKATTAAEAAETCTVNDPTGTPLNVRKRASQHAPIIGALNNGITVSTRMSRGDWVHIVPHKAPGKSGWVWRKFIDCPKSTQKGMMGEADNAWNCGETIIGYANQDLGPSTAGVGPDGKPIGNDDLTTIWVVNPPREGFVFKQYSTPHRQTVQMPE
jgi:hypothetical protein